MDEIPVPIFDPWIVEFLDAAAFDTDDAIVVQGVG
jgi:hypothetical protein